MPDEQNNNEEAIFKAAVKLETNADRIAYIKDACGDDSELLVRVMSLLEVHGTKDDVIDALMRGMASTLNGPAVFEGPGAVIGRYKLLEQIGEGGFGVVYMAEQTEPINRRVALKIIKLGMDTKQVIARFEAERQALAMMDHPNIAKVHDAGATDTGRPYFVMELVRGIPITEYCDRNNLDTQQRLELFSEVCKAVQHAHQKGIIHRDIKPSNVLITLHDGRPVPKVIDFGIAKATHQKLTEKTLFTRFAQMIGTPEYMSPEQAEMSGLDIDARSDIYSLGVLLYQLLTGVTPFDAQKLREAGYAEMQRIIREEEPERPSTRLSAMGEALTEVAKHRRVSPDFLRKQVRGDLDWIVMKTLEKDRTRRYERAIDLAVDIERHLNNEPVLAAPPTASYRLQKFVRRNRVAVITFSLVAGALAIGAGAATVVVWSSGSLAGKVQHAAGMGQRHVWDVPEMSSLFGGISSDGRYLSYVDWTFGNLAVYDLMTETNWSVTKNTDPTWKTSDGSNEYSIVSPDGKRIAYSWLNHTDPLFYDLRIIDLDGSNMRVLYHDPNAVFGIVPADFSPDGKEVLAYFSAADANLVDESTGIRVRRCSLVLVSVADCSVRILKTWHRRGFLKRAAFSPDGRYVAYDSEHEDDLIRHDIFLIDLDGGGETLLIEHPASDRLCGWTPDGRRIVFTSDRSSKRDLWMIDVAEGLPLGPPQKLISQFKGWPIGLTSDGAFYYGVDKEVSNVYIARLDSTGSSFEGEPELASYQFVGSTTMGEWSPDGSLLAYRAGSSRFSGGPLVVRSLETSQERVVSSMDLFLFHTAGGMIGPWWSSDGHSLLIWAEGLKDGRGLYTVNVETGTAELTAKPPGGRLRCAVWAPDGTTIYTRSPKNISRLDPATGQETELYPSGDPTRGLDVSPDGRWLAFCKGEDSLLVMPSEGGEPHEVVHLDNDEVNAGLRHVFVRWTPDGKHLLFPKRQKELWKVEVDTGEQGLLGEVPGDLVNATMHPNGRQIALTVQQDEGCSALWVMENFLPE